MSKWDKILFVHFVFDNYEKSKIDEHAILSHLLNSEKWNKLFISIQLIRKIFVLKKIIFNKFESNKKCFEAKIHDYLRK